MVKIMKVAYEQLKLRKLVYLFLIKTQNHPAESKDQRKGNITIMYFLVNDLM